MTTAMTTPPTPTTSPTTDRKFIADFAPNERFEGIFTICNAQLGTTRNGKPYLRCLLRDRTGELPARMWSIPEEVFAALPANGFVEAHGETQPYQGELQLILHRIARTEPTDEQLRDLLPTSERDPAEMFAELVALLNTIEHPAMKALCRIYLDDEMLMSQFRVAPAAMMLHHAYLGGLLEHTLNLCNVANATLPFYPRLSRNIVLMGLFLHDLGKTRELQYDQGFGYTDRGQLIGHLVDGAIMLHDKAQTLMREQGIRLPRHALTVLQHIIISHHTKPEFGAAKIPSTPEAVFVGMLDDLDAKTFISLNAARPERSNKSDLGGAFTEKNWALGTKLFRPEPLG